MAASWAPGWGRAPYWGHACVPCFRLHRCRRRQHEVENSVSSGNLAISLTEVNICNSVLSPRPNFPVRLPRVLLLSANHTRKSPCGLQRHLLELAFHWVGHRQERAGSWATFNTQHHFLMLLRTSSNSFVTAPGSKAAELISKEKGRRPLENASSSTDVLMKSCVAHVQISLSLNF